MDLSETDAVMPSMFEGLQLPAIFDAHVHLRSGEMMETVVGTIRDGGADMVYVMASHLCTVGPQIEPNSILKPNLVPPITNIEMALDYQSKLKALEPNVTFLMSLFLCPALTPDMIVEARKAGIKGVKSYPVPHSATVHSARRVITLTSD